MKKLIAILLSLFLVSTNFAQTKAEEDYFKYVKSFYDNLKKVKLDGKETLFWKYTYADTSLATLTKLSKVFEKENVKTMTLAKSKDPKEKNLYELTVYEKKAYKNSKLLHERVVYLNSIATILSIQEDQSIISAHRPDKVTYVEDYDSVGKKKKID